MKTKLYFLLFFTLCLGAPQMHGCTTFLLKDVKGNLYFGRNYDFPVGEGMIHINGRNRVKQAMVTPPDRPFSWVSLYGSISFTQVGKEFPYGGMNEAGLVIEVMWLDGTRYPEPDERVALNELQWIQYQLDRAATLQQVIDSDTLLRISDKPFSYLHFLVTDVQGNSAAIEFLDGRMVVHRDEGLPVRALSNSTYETSLRYRCDFKNGDVGHYDKREQNSSGRFTKAAARMEAYDGVTDPVTYAFETLDSVAQGEHTRWSIVYDINRRVIYYQTAVSPRVKTIAMDDFNFACEGLNLCRSIDITAFGTEGFQPVTPEIHMHYLKRMKEKVAFLKELPQEQMDTMASWYLSGQCN